MNIKNVLMFSGLALTVGGMTTYASTLVPEDYQLMGNSIVSSVESVEFDREIPEGAIMMKKYELTEEDLKELEAAGFFSYEDEKGELISSITANSLSEETMTVE